MRDDIYHEEEEETGWRRKGKRTARKEAKARRGGRGWRRPGLFRIAALILMGVLLAALGRGFWMERAALGSVLRAVEERNYAALFYLLLILATAACGAVSLLWILSKRHVYYEGRLLRVDVGRGILPFLFFIVLAFISARAALRLPDDSWLFRGLSQYFLVTASVQSLIYICGGLGILCCIMRKLCR